MKLSKAPLGAGETGCVDPLPFLPFIQEDLTCPSIIFRHTARALAQVTSELSAMSSAHQDLAVLLKKEEETVAEFSRKREGGRRGVSAVFLFGADAGCELWSGCFDSDSLGTINFENSDIYIYEGHGSRQEARAFVDDFRWNFARYTSRELFSISSTSNEV